jgi:hypothetical protein
MKIKTKEQKECQQGMKKWQQTIIGVSKRHVGNAKGVKLNMNFFLSSNKEHQDIEDWRH